MTAPEISAESTVSYTVKEVLDEQTALLRGIDKKVDEKASKADLAVLDTKIEGHGGRITVLEQHQHITEASRRWRNKAWGVAGTIGGIAAVIVAGLISALHH